MRHPPRLPGKAPITALFAVAVCATLAAVTLTVVVVTEPGPERCCPTAGAPADARPSPSGRTPSARGAGPPMCVIGSWRSVDESLTVKFYTDQPAMTFTGGGRLFEFRPDGTGQERHDNTAFTSGFRGNQLRIVGNGTVEFTWTATDRNITYVAQTSATLTWSYYDQRGLLSTQPLTPNPTYNDTEEYQCQPTQFVESDSAEGYRARWLRTTGFGVYG